MYFSFSTERQQTNVSLESNVVFSEQILLHSKVLLITNDISINTNIQTPPIKFIFPLRLTTISEINPMRRWRICIPTYRIPLMIWCIVLTIKHQTVDTKYHNTKSRILRYRSRITVTDAAYYFSHTQYPYKMLHIIAKKLSLSPKCCITMKSWYIPVRDVTYF